MPRADSKGFRNMLKNIIIIFLILAFPAGRLHSQTTKIGHMNVELLLANMPEMKVVEKQLKDLETKLASGLQAKRNYYEDKKNTYFEKLDGKSFASEAEKTTLEQEIVKLEKELMTAPGAAEENLLKKQSELMVPVIEKVQKAIDEIAVAEKFTYVLNITSGGNILYGAENLDITELVAKKLNVTIAKDDQ